MVTRSLIKMKFQQWNWSQQSLQNWALRRRKMMLRKRNELTKIVHESIWKWNEIVKLFYELYCCLIVLLGLTQSPWIVALGLGLESSSLAPSGAGLAISVHQFVTLVIVWSMFIFLAKILIQFYQHSQLSLSTFSALSLWDYTVSSWVSVSIHRIFQGAWQLNCRVEM